MANQQCKLHHSILIIFLWKKYLLIMRDMQHFGIKVSIIEPGFFKTESTNLELIEKNLRQLWERLTPETRITMGQSILIITLKYNGLQCFHCVLLTLRR
ncbi:hypothetical protein scyTo_0002727 [Scyliorhinus torazame]|uniref:Uncharacterized protein n=1 Tax=Scyliorhinus torazame TaxID=75743 RepID=A0A401PKI5_SCYTO|nr:hypothetical protein [Scyliorhinus torazame]